MRSARRPYYQASTECLQDPFGEPTPLHSESESDREDCNGGGIELSDTGGATGEPGSSSKPARTDYSPTMRSRWFRNRLLTVCFCFLVGFGGGMLQPLKSARIDSYDSSWQLRPDNTQDLISNVAETAYVSGKVATRVEVLPQLIVVTPTYVRPFQSMYLTRLINTLSLVRRPLLWIVIETAWQSVETSALLRKSGLMYRHLVAKENTTDVKDRGVHQRNAALEHIEEHRLDGIVFFADDDNVYRPELFEEIRKTKRFGTWPVGMLQQAKSRPIIEGPVCQGSSVIGWHTNEKSKAVRRFHVDMCGFAFNSTILWDPARWQKPTTALIRQLDSIKEGFQETTFIEQLVPDERYMEALADSCSKTLVWHLHLEATRTRIFSHGNLKAKLPVTLPLAM